jgi:hypothetical protein
VRALPVALAWSLALGAGGAAAEESVKVRYFPSYPLPDQSAEFVQLSVSRVARATPGAERDVDRYIASVRDVLDDAAMPAKWGSVTPDASWVQVEITLGERKHVLANAYDAGGVRLRPDATASDRRRAAALQRVLDLTVERAATRLAP